MCRKPGNTEDSHVTTPSSTRAAGSSPRDKRRRDIPQSTLISAQLGPLPSSLLWWERLPLVGWSVVPGGTHSSSACTRYARVLIQDRAFSSARNRSTCSLRRVSKHPKTPLTQCSRLVCRRGGSPTPPAQPEGLSSFSLLQLCMTNQVL